MPLLHPPEPPPAGQKHRWGGLQGAGQALAISEAAQQFDGLTLVITDGAKSAAQLETELQFFNSELPVLHFPDWETLPYDLFSPHQDIISERLRCLYRLPQVSKGILIVPASTLMHRLAPPSFISGHSFVYKAGDTVNVDRLREQLQQAGYQCVDTVYEHGEYAVRGALVDIFPMGSKQPFRLDLFDDEIESLRSFDPESQRTIDQLDAIDLLPAKEVPLDKPGIRRFQDNWHSRFDADPRSSALYQDVSNGAAAQGIEYFLPLFFGGEFEQCATLFDYLPGDTQVFTSGNLETAAGQFWQEASNRFEEYGVDRERPLLPPAEVFVPVNELFAALKQWPRIDLTANQQSGTGASNFSLQPAPDVAVDSRASNPLLALQSHLFENQQRVLYCAESAGRRETLLELLASIRQQPVEVANWQEFLNGNHPSSITIAPLDRGLTLEHPAICLISEGDLFGQQVLQRRRRSRTQDQADNVIKNLTELREGAPVVHIDHGVGRYRGLQTIGVNDEMQEFLTLEYADDTKLYVPVSSLHLISRYSGSEEDTAPLHRLGSDSWKKAKDKAAKEIRDTAAELLQVYAQRAARQGFSFSDPAEDYLAFSRDFPFEETPDQQDAIDAVKKDLLAEQPMDRLVCGDVGFGKTEVAMRAAFIAVSNSKQVIILVPTTLLAQQHYENFKDRFANWPVTVEVLSRFRTAKEQEAVIQRAADGKVDILIGTHKLLNSRIKYKNLGLLIIDEEHRFGVRQKEAVKALRAEVDILTMTATPIPRTLNMAFGGIRDLSIIATPPAKRLAVKTFIRQSETRLIREAILRETLRGGQVYYLHNEVKTIDKVARELQELVPEARIGIGHGKMRERELEQVMSDFYHQRFNLLVCTTIIETGIDVPSANTIIIDRADKFGIAQLHQLRGRVGRSHHQAYAYLLTPHPKTMTRDGVKRLEAIEAADHLGSGFTLATHDLEIRGAGELLGDEQSGHIQRIGFTLYMELLEKAVQAIQDGREPDVEAAMHDNVEINLRIPALIPDDYLPDVPMRLQMYKRLASAKNNNGLKELQVEMIDRFGLLPDYLKNLIRVTELRLQAEQLGITKIEANATGGGLTFGSATTVEPITIVQLVQQQPDRYRFQGATELRFSAAMKTSDLRINTVKKLLELLQSGSN
ncbi:transcription-repair coupling factor [Porticoccus sp. GXU_MW_L64]